MPKNLSQLTERAVVATRRPNCGISTLLMLHRAAQKVKNAEYFTLSCGKISKMQLEYRLFRL